MRINKVFAVLAIVSAAGYFACEAAMAQAEAPCRACGDQKPRITVSGTGKVTAKPDEATITIGVMNEDKSLKKCFELQTAGMNRVIDQIKAAGVKEEDIKTLGYNVTPRYKDNRPVWGGVKPDSYQVSHTLSIKVRDITKLGGLIDKVVDSGANNINNLYFGSSRMEELEMEAKVKAVENAKAKTAAMAKGAGVKTGKILEISDSGTSMPVYRGQVKAFAMMADSASPQMEPGSIEVNAECVLVTEVVEVN